MQRRRRVVAFTAAVLAACAVVAGCSSSGRTPARSSPGSRPPATGGPDTRHVVTPVFPTHPPSPAPASATPRSSAATSSSPAAAAFAQMSERQRVGQLIMVDCPSTGVAGATATAITRDAVGSVILDGTSHGGVGPTRAVTDGLRRLAPTRVGLFVATDQEGGLVQRLQGPGFSTIPSAVDQGAISPGTLRRDARQWGAQLVAAGVDVDLAPVLDVVPAGTGSNPPIGDLDREYGHTPGAVTAAGLAYADGMDAAGIDVTVKHFPGLGRVHGNTDTSAGVTDTVTTADDPDLAPFAAAVRARVPFVMMSTASYARIDPGVPAAFSSRIVTGLLRGRLGFGGIVISDDVGVAAQVSNYSPGQRAVRFVEAGGDIVLTVVADQAQEMTAALLARAQSDRAFRAKVDAAALLVLQAKQAQGLLR